MKQLFNALVKDGFISIFIQIQSWEFNFGNVIGYKLPYSKCNK